MKTDTYFTRSQIAMAKEAETLILIDLKTRITAKELAERFSVSESSFKFYVKGILGDSYLNCFRKKRMEKAAELLETTNLKVIEIASAVGYEIKENSQRSWQTIMVFLRRSFGGYRSRGER